MSGWFLGSLPNPFGVTFPTLVMPKKLVPCLWSVILGILFLMPTSHPPALLHLSWVLRPLPIAENWKHLPEHGARTRRGCIPFFWRGGPPSELLVEDSSLYPHPEQRGQRRVVQSDAHLQGQGTEAWDLSC